MRIHTVVLLLALGGLCLPAHGASWLDEALDGIEQGVDAFYAAEFDEAVEHLVPAMKTLSEKFDEHPVQRTVLERGAVYLILSLHAREMDEEARDVALGLAELSVPPWGKALDLAPDARAYLEELAATMPPAAYGTLTITHLDEGCAVDVDGDPVIAGSPVSLKLPAGVHWIGVACHGAEISHERVEIDQDAETRVSPGAPIEEATTTQEDPPPPPKKDPLLLKTDVQPVTWYGDGWNLALQGAGIVLLGVGAGLLGGSMRYEEQAYRTHTLEYAELESKAFDMEVSGWVLLGTGAIALTVGTIRMALTGGEE